MPSMKVMPSVESGSGLDHVAFVDVVALVQNDRNAVADRGRGTRQLGHMADHLGNARAAVGLRQLDVTGQRIDDVAGEMSAIGRGQRGPLLALEVVVQNQFAVVAGKNEVDARALEVAGEEQMRIGNDDRVGRRMRRNGVDVDMPMRVGSPGRQAADRRICRPSSNGTTAAKVNIYIIFKV